MILAPTVFKAGSSESVVAAGSPSLAVRGVRL